MNHQCTEDPISNKASVTGDAAADMGEYTEELIKAVQNGASMQDIHDVSNETMRGIYKLAYEFYQSGKLNDAESLFRFLCIYDFQNSEYAMGLAAVYQLKENYAVALDFYALAYTLAKEDYRPMFYAGQCNLMLCRTARARKCFNIVAEKSVDNEMKIKAQAYLSVINRFGNNKKAASANEIKEII